MRAKNPLLSRKLWTAVIAALVVFLAQYAGVQLDLQTVLGMILPIIAYIAGESFVDAKRASPTDPFIQLTNDINGIYLRYRNKEMSQADALKAATDLLSDYNLSAQQGQPAPDFLLQPFRSPP